MKEAHFESYVHLTQVDKAGKIQSGETFSANCRIEPSNHGRDGLNFRSRHYHCIVSGPPFSPSSPSSSNQGSSAFAPDDGGEYRIQVASSETPFLPSSKVARNVRASRLSSTSGSRSASRRPGSSQTRGTRTIRNPEIAKALRKTTPSDGKPPSTSRSP